MGPGHTHRHALPWRDPWQVVEAIAAELGAEGLVWLDGDGSDLGRWARLGFSPLQGVCCRGLPGSSGGQDPFAALANLERQSDGSGSWMGWLAYEAGAWIEPAAHWREPPMALLWAARYGHELVFDLQQQRLWLEGEPKPGQPLAAVVHELISALPQDEPAAAAPAETLRLPLQNWQWHTDPARFAVQVQQIRDWIAAGDLFQANLTACCQTTLPASAPSGPQAALALYGRLRRRCPAPFAGLAIGTGAAAGEALLCSSPERFLRRDGAGLVETRPIKGTRPRSDDPRADGDAAADLVSSPKDRAENVMIVDLLRNDLGRVCRPGSIQVPQLVGLESYRQVHHLTSVIEGQMDPAISNAALLRACWPGGSISGAPKIRACQRLGELEPVPRGPYCGSLFRLGGDGSLDSNIIIRSLMLKDRSLRAHAGCGIVADSDPAAEAAELGWKLDPLLQALA
jgi:para-aminobenzoate synthetase component 1